MRKAALLLLAIASVAMMAAAAEKKLHPYVYRDVTAALANERAAAARYLACAEKAQQEGYEGVASLFRAAAQAEKTHAARFAKMLKATGNEVPADATPPPSIGSTSENVRAAVGAEQGERDSTYRNAIDTCKQWNDESCTTVFDNTRDAEVEHANLFVAVGRDLEKFKKEHSFYVCEICGYTTDVGLKMCPVCRARQDLEKVR